MLKFDGFINILDNVKGMKTTDTGTITKKPDVKEKKKDK